MLSRLAIPPVEGDPAAAVLDRLSQKTMPPGALGRLAALAPTLARAQRTEHPAARPAEALVFAADHGLHAEGTSPWPQAVTALMVETLCAGGAAAAVLAREAGARLTVVDVGVATAYRAAPPGLVEARVRAGTRNAAREDALTPAEVEAALEAGAAAAEAAISRGARVLCPGEMGIANTAAAALVAHAVAGLALDALAGPGAGLGPGGIGAKRAMLARCAARRPGPLSAGEALAAFGGLEIAAMAGAMVAGAAHGAAVLVDGFIATAAALAARAARPEIAPALIFAHVSAEPGHRLMLDHLGAEPLLDLGLRLGEGTGGLLALPLLSAACAVLDGMATFEAIGLAGPGT